MKRSGLLLLSAICLSILFFLHPMPMLSQVPLHEKIVLKGFDGNPLTVHSKEPYSPRKTCGTCHDYDRITRGYHFQQGRTDGTGKIIVSDQFDSKYSWNLSAGMYGKYSVICLDASQLAKKVNTHPSEMDKSSFYFARNCGPCHPGGGWAEYDRKGNLYYNGETKKFGYELSGDEPQLDGDYTAFSMGDAGYGASWDRSGPNEADCLICHLKGYQWKERRAALRAGLFKYSPTLGVGWGTVKISAGNSGDSTVESVEIDYLKKEVADADNLHLQIVRRPGDDNCWSCHGDSEGKKQGRQWNSETDVHKSKGLNCVSCHPADKEHNFAKGNTLQQTVRDDLDHTMPSCEDCHYKGKDKKAPKYRHPFSPKHMRRIACQTCHIPFQTAPADIVYDLSTGTTVVYETSKFLSAVPTDPQKKASDSFGWFPAIREFKGRIVPTRSVVPIYFGDLDEKEKVAKPIPLWKIRELKKPEIKDNNGDGIPEINTSDEIKAFLKILCEKDRFGNPVANHPVLLKGGFLYQLDKKGELEKIKHEQAAPIDFSLSHQIVSGPAVTGSKGCKDCHSKNATFFLRKILIDPYDERGKPVYIETWERLGMDKERLERLLSVE